MSFLLFSDSLLQKVLDTVTVDQPSTNDQWQTAQEIVIQVRASRCDDCSARSLSRVRSNDEIVESSYVMDCIILGEIHGGSVAFAMWRGLCL